MDEKLNIEPCYVNPNYNLRMRRSKWKLSRNGTQILPFQDNVKIGGFKCSYDTRITEILYPHTSGIQGTHQWKRLSECWFIAGPAYEASGHHSTDDRCSTPWNLSKFQLSNPLSIEQHVKCTFHAVVVKIDQQCEGRARVRHCCCCPGLPGGGGCHITGIPPEADAHSSLCTRRCPNVAVMLVERIRCWPNITKNY